MSEPASSIFRVILSQLQARRLRQFLDRSRDRAGVEGILCTISRYYDAASGGTVLELQAARLSRGAIRKIQKIISEELEPHQPPEVAPKESAVPGVTSGSASPPVIAPA